MKELNVNSADIKRYARKIVNKAFDEILMGNFMVPTIEEAEDFLKEDMIVYSFDKYAVRKKVADRSPLRDEDQIKDEVNKIRVSYEDEYYGVLRKAASETVIEIENLITTLMRLSKMGRLDAWDKQ